MQGQHGIGTGALDLPTAPRLATDTALVAAVRAGDDPAFEELYRRYNRRISAFVYGFLRDEGRAEDVTQEAFLSALRRLRETDSEIAFRPWIYEIARNAAIDLYRRTSRTEEVSINGDSPLPLGDRRRLVGSIAPENAMVDKERLEHLRGALDELSETHHRIIVLRELEGRSYREIGDSMDLTAPAVESTLFRARRRLEKEYSELDTGRRCASMRAIIARLAEGVELPRERRKLERHALRCSRCRRRARELGVEPMRQGGLVSRAAALLPLPAILRRRLADNAWTSAAGSAADGGGALIGKAGALIAAAVLAGGGGATLGGFGPLAPAAREYHPVPTLDSPAPEPILGGARDRAPKAARTAEGARAGGLARRAVPPGAAGPSAGSAPPAAVTPTEPPAAPAGPPLNQGLPELPPVDQPPPPGQVSIPQAEVPEAIQLEESQQEPASAIGTTATAAATAPQLPPAP